jgi:sporulation protein YlmC with PRC-barrel domain
MRASDLLGQEVVARDGQRIGIVTDLRCELDGPLLGTLAAPRVHALVVSRHRAGSLLGYDRRRQQGPWLLAALIRRWHRHTVLVPWSLIAEYADGIQLRVNAIDLPHDLL